MSSLTGFSVRSGPWSIMLSPTSECMHLNGSSRSTCSNTQELHDHLDVLVICIALTKCAYACLILGCKIYRMTQPAGYIKFLYQVFFNYVLDRLATN